MANEKDNLLFKIKIETPAISTNKLMRMHWRKRTEILRQYMWLVTSQICSQRIEPVNVPVRIVFTLIKPNGKGVKDKQNLSLLEKAITDLFVEKRIFADDSHQHVVDTKLDIIIDSTIKTQTLVYEVYAGVVKT